MSLSKKKHFRLVNCCEQQNYEKKQPKQIHTDPIQIPQLLPVFSLFTKPLKNGGFEVLGGDLFVVGGDWGRGWFAVFVVAI